MFSASDGLVVGVIPSLGENDSGKLVLNEASKASMLLNKLQGLPSSDGANPKGSDAGDPSCSSLKLLSLFFDFRLELKIGCWIMSGGNSSS